jgi:Glycosyl hydrolase family 92 N-terminal domain
MGTIAPIALALTLAACAGSSPSSGVSHPDGSVADVLAADVPAAPLDPVRATAPFVRYADPRIGSGGDGFGTGSAFPGPQRAFGLARPGPDTTNARGLAAGFAHCAGYAYSDAHIAGFSQLHMHGMGIVDYGVIGFMPTIGMSAAQTRQTGYLQPFRHERETVAAGLLPRGLRRHGDDHRGDRYGACCALPRDLSPRARRPTSSSTSGTCCPTYA